MTFRQMMHKIGNQCAEMAYTLGNGMYLTGDLLAPRANSVIVDDRPTVEVVCEDCGTVLPIPLDITVNSDPCGDLELTVEPEFDALRVHHWTHEQEATADS